MFCFVWLLSQKFVFRFVFGDFSFIQAPSEDCEALMQLGLCALFVFRFDLSAIRPACCVGCFCFLGFRFDCIVLIKFVLFCFRSALRFACCSRCVCLLRSFANVLATEERKTALLCDGDDAGIRFLPHPGFMQLR